MTDAPNQGIATCPNCGAQLAAIAPACPACGRAIGAAEMPATPWSADPSPMPAPPVAETAPPPTPDSASFGYGQPPAYPPNQPYGAAPGYPFGYGLAPAPTRSRKPVFIVLGLIGLIAVVAAGALFVFVVGRATKGASLSSAAIVENIPEGNIFVKYEGKEIVKIVLDFKFDPQIVSSLNPAAGDEYRHQVCLKLLPGAHLAYNGSEVDRQYAYWPDAAGTDYATGLTLFYLVPPNRPAGSLRLTYDGAVLGEGVADLDTVLAV